MGELSHSNSSAEVKCEQPRFYEHIREKGVVPKLRFKESKTEFRNVPNKRIDISIYTRKVKV